VNPALDRRGRAPAPSRWQRFTDLLGRFSLLIAAVFAIYGFVVSTRRSDEINRLAHKAEATATASRHQGIIEARDRRQAVAANVGARYDDCVEANRLRRALRDQVISQQRTQPLLLQLLPSLNTPRVLALIRATTARQLRAYHPRNCRRFADEALPRPHKKKRAAP
jgi:hypothetical protein